MSRGIAANYVAPYAYTYGTEGPDLFKKEDVQVLAQAHDHHDHSPGLGVPINGANLVDGSIPATKLVAGAVANQPVGGDLTGTVSAATIYLRKNSNIYTYNQTDVLHALLSGGGGYTVLFGMENGWLFRNYASDHDVFVLDNAGNATIGGSLTINGPNLAMAAPTVMRFAHGGAISDYDGGASGGYVNISQLTVTPGLTAVSTLNVNGPLNANASSVLNGTTSMTGNASVAGALTVGAGVAVGQALTVGTTSTFNGVATHNQDITLTGQRVVSFNNSECLVSPGTNIGHPGAVYLSPHAYVFFDLGVGHILTCQSLVQTSDPNLKAGATVMGDHNCMLRVRDPGVPVYTYQLTPPAPAPPNASPTPTPNEIGFMAPDVFNHSPEFAALDQGSNPVGVNYANMSAMIWGALRDLDKRCTTFGIPA